MSANDINRDFIEKQNQELYNAIENQNIILNEILNEIKRQNNCVPCINQSTKMFGNDITIMSMIKLYY